MSLTGEHVEKSPCSAQPQQASVSDRSIQLREPHTRDRKTVNARERLWFPKKKKKPMFSEQDRKVAHVNSQ